jgi:putative lipase involved disintegration of autophagic bodies
VAPSYKAVPSYQEIHNINVWSSGLWVCTSTGSTAAMSAAGGFTMETKCEDLQYMVREHLTDKGKDLMHKDTFYDIDLINYFL